MRPRARTRGAALLVSMAAAGALLGLGEVTGAAFGSPGAAPTSAAPVAAPVSAAPASLRVWGSDRYATAAAVSAATFPSGTRVAYVATGSDYPDALTAAAAAGGRGPVLLGGAGGLPPATLSELQRLHPTQVVIVGGTAGLPATTEAAVRAALPSATVTRLSGTDRYATAAAVASATFHSPVKVAWVATGEAFPDALGAAAATGGRGPVLLVPHQGIPLATTFALGSLQPAQVFVVGGANAIAPQTQATLARVAPHAIITRVAGADRYATAAAVSGVAFPAGAATAFLATGQAFPDALTSAAAAGGRGPVLLVGGAAVPPVVMSELQRLRPVHLVLVGGREAISNTLTQQLAVGLAGPTPTTTTSAPTSLAPTTTSAPTSHVPTTASAPTSRLPTTTSAVPSTSTALVPTSTAPGPIGPTTTLPGSPAASPSPNANVAVATAEAQLGKPYQWAGAGPDNFDCSGLTMFAWAAAGVALPHNAAAQQAMLPPVVPDQADLAPGDLLFYDDPVDHVAMYVGGGMMVEAAHSGVPVRMVTMRTDGLVGAGRP